MKILITAANIAIFLASLVSTNSALAENVPNVNYRTITIENVNIFYREAGDPDKPTVLLLHGFPTSSHMFRDLIPELSDEYHVVAPDYPGYGFSSMPAVGEFDYSFDNIARLMTRFVDEIGVDRFSVYLMDYGAPVGFRIASNQPERIESLIIQNGNAYDEGIDNNFWEPIKAYWVDRKSVNKGLDNAWWKNIKAAYKQPNMSNDAALRFLTTLGATKWQYTNGVKNVEAVSPDTWGHVQPLLDREGTRTFSCKCFTAMAPIHRFTQPGKTTCASISRPRSLSGERTTKYFHQPELNPTKKTSKIWSIT
jgi:pimeloyl-ACP methyl ester carboxylesterase